VRHNQFKYYGYATAINVLDFTSCVVPVTFADQGVDVANKDFMPLNDMDAAVQAECKFLATRVVSWTFTTDIHLDDAGAYHGAPVAIQVIGRRLTEERIIAIAKEIGELLAKQT
jgi:amidase